MGKRPPRHVADTPFALWLDGRIGDRSLGQVEQGSGVGKSLLSDYLGKGKKPSEASVRKLAAYFGVPQAEVEALVRPEPAEAETGSGVLGVLEERLARLEAGQARLQLTLEEATALFVDAQQRRRTHDWIEAAAGDDAVPDAAWDAEPDRPIVGTFPVRVRGDGLAPYLEDGMVAWVNPREGAEPGAYVLVEHGGARVFKRVETTADGGLLLVSRPTPADPHPEIALADAVVLGAVELRQNPRRR